MAKTAAQLQAEADARAREAAKLREAEEKKAAEASTAAGWGDYIKSWIPDFSFFNILLFVAVACGAYFLGRTAQGKELLGGIFGPERVNDFFANGDQLLAGAASKLGIDLDISATLEAMPIEQVRTTLAERDVPAPVITILARDQATFRNFLNVIKTANGGRIGINDLTPEALVAGPALNALLAPANRASTVALMHAAMPSGAGISEKTLTALIDHNMVGNKPTAALRTLLSAGVDGRLQTLQASMNDTAGKFSPVKAVDMLLNAQNRSLIRSIGTDNIAIVMAEKSPTLDKKTLDAALKFGDEIDVANTGPNRPRALEVLRAVASIGQGVDAKTAFKNITADELSGFFAVPANQTAVSKLLNVVQPDLAKYWGNANQGLAEVLASTPDADKILRFMRGDLAWLQSTANTLVKQLPSAITPSLETQLRYFGGGELAENAGSVAGFISALPTPPPARPSRPPAR